VADLEIRTIDPLDEPLLHQWWMTGHAAHAERPFDLGLSWEFRRTSLSRPNPERETVLLAAFDGADDGRRMVGAAEIQLPLNDNTHLAYVEVDVPAAERRRGIGSSLLAEVEARVRTAGRTHVLGMAFALPGGRSPGVDFGAARGFAVANVEQQKVIDLAERGPALDDLEAEVVGRLAGYRVVTWGTETPEEHIESYCRLLSGFVSALPDHDLALEDSVWTPERVRVNEARARDVGRLTVVAAAVAPDGTLAGVSDVRPSTPDLSKAFIGITIVGREHRGHSLGLAMKLATHRELRATYPQCRIVATANAGINEHMNAINGQMGYRVVEDLLDLQKVL
jgi:GNAT superfamily N-acetyltransferase